MFRGRNTAQGGSDSSVVRTTLIEPPARTAAVIGDITRTNLDDFTQNITQPLYGQRFAVEHFFF